MAKNSRIDMLIESDKKQAMIRIARHHGSDLSKYTLKFYDKQIKKHNQILKEFGFNFDEDI